MIKRTGLFVTILLTAIMLQAIQLQSQAFDFLQSKLATAKASAGAIGGKTENETFVDEYLLSCKTDKCQAILNEADKVWLDIKKNSNEITKIINSSNDPNVVTLRKQIEKLVNDFNSLNTNSDQKDLLKEQIQNTLSELINLILPSNPNLKILVETCEAKRKELDDLKVKYIQEFNLWKFGPEPTTPEQPSEPDQTDCPKQSMGQFPNGELIAWGIPGFGGFSIPDSSCSSKKEKSVEGKNVSNKTIQSLKVVEDNSEKVTQEEIGTFLQELDNPDANLN